jgi:hypothetical protein
LKKHGKERENDMVIVGFMKEKYRFDLVKFGVS